MEAFGLSRSKENRAGVRRAFSQLRTLECAMIFVFLAGSPALGQDLKQASSTLSATISESAKKRVAVVDFTDLQGNVTELGRYLAEELSGALVNDARGFRIIERTQLKAILQEHKLAATGLIDPGTARQLGKIAGVDTLVTGTIVSAFGDTVRVMIKALDVSTAEIIGQSTADIPKTEAIQRLLGADVGGDPVSQPPTEQRSRALSVEANNLLFVMKTCRRSGGGFTCEGSVTNQGRQRRSFQFAHMKWVDNIGNIYESPSFYLGPRAHFSTGSESADLEPDLPLNFSAEQKDVDRSAKEVTLVMYYRATGIDWEAVTFRKMAIK